MNEATLVALRDTFIDRNETPKFEDLRKVIKEVYIAEYLLGKGGRAKMTFSDWGRIGNMLRKQYSFLDKFAQDIRDGRLSAKQIAARARLYIRSATAAFERGKLSSHGISSSLLQVPGDGQTECGVNCRCHLAITEDEHSWYVRWILDPSCKHCADCPDLAKTWNPLVIKK